MNINSHTTIFPSMLETSQSSRTALLHLSEELVFFSFHSCEEDIFDTNYLS